jgi:magnesium transporter
MKPESITKDTSVRAAASLPVAAGYTLNTVAFDFSTKSVRELPAAGIAGTVGRGEHLWVDLEYSDAGAAAAQEALGNLGLVGVEVVEEIFSDGVETHLFRGSDHYHLVLSVCSMEGGAHLEFGRIDVVAHEDFILTVHRGSHFVIDTVRGEYRTDFERHAQTPSFLVYEIWDALIEHYAEVEKHLDVLVERLQARLMQANDEEVFAHVSDIGEDLLHFRGILMPARTVLVEMASRKSHLVSEATQAALIHLAATLERVLQDVLMDREIITQSLNLHMSMISHRTNRAMGKLTIVSTIFLPLMFLCGVYGMNFSVFPELHWKYGYAFFWFTCAAIVLVLVLVLRRNRLM